MKQSLVGMCLVGVLFLHHWRKSIFSISFFSVFLISLAVYGRIVGERKNGWTPKIDSLIMFSVTRWDQDVWMRLWLETLLLTPSTCQLKRSLNTIKRRVSLNAIIFFIHLNKIAQVFIYFFPSRSENSLRQPLAVAVLKQQKKKKRKPVATRGIQ